MNTTINYQPDDTFFTPLPTAINILTKALQFVPELLNLEWVEPSAGTGSFLTAANQLGLTNYTNAYDLTPRHSSVQKQNFLTLTTPLQNKAVIGNPPYGQRNNLTLQFINHSFELGAEYVGFLLMGSMINWDYIKKINNAKQIYISHHPTKFELSNGETKTINGNRFVFIIYKKENGYTPTIENQYYTPTYTEPFTHILQNSNLYPKTDEQIIDRRRGIKLHSPTRLINPELDHYLMIQNYDNDFENTVNIVKELCNLQLSKKITVNNINYYKDNYSKLFK